MSGKMSFEIPGSQRTSVRSYASRVFKESAVGMVSTVASTTSIPRKVFKVVALILCLTGFLYQSGKFLYVTFQYPTTVDIDVSRPKLFDVPAYTFCNDNGINRRLFCKKYPDRCEKPNQALCKKYESYCGGNESLVPKKEYYNYPNNMSEEELLELNVELDKFVWTEREMIEKIAGPYLRQRSLGEPQFFLCYMLNDRVNSRLEPVNSTKLFHTDLIKSPVDKLHFQVEPEEMFLPGYRAGILFALHSPFQAVNPFQSGIFMKPGRTYMVYVSMEEEILQKRPYDTDCVNYTEIWERNGRTGPRMQEMCRHDCLSDLSIKCANCVFPFLLFPRQERYCTSVIC